LSVNATDAKNYLAHPKRKLGQWYAMECKDKESLEQHLSDIRILAAGATLTIEEERAASRAEQFAIARLKEHLTSGHNGKPCPFATVI
jgi:hypothetical protein